MKLKSQEKIFEISMSTRTSRGYRLLEKFRKMLLHPGAMTEIQTVFFGKIDNVLLVHSTSSQVSINQNSKLCWLILVL